MDVTTRELIYKLIQLRDGEACTVVADVEVETDAIYGADAGADVDAGAVKTAREAGWIDAQDILWLERPVERRSAARIIHEFLLHNSNFQDTRDWSNARKLRDLYDCKVCAKHVAQMVESGIMPPTEMNRFRLLDHIDEDELKAIINRVAGYMDNTELE